MSGSKPVQPLSSSTLSALDKALIHFLYQQVESPSSVLLVSMAMVASSVSQGHVCLPIDELVELKSSDIDALSLNLPADSPLPKNKTQWVAALSTESRINCIGTGNPNRQVAPGTLLVCDESERLYLPRFFDLETRLIYQLRLRAKLNNLIDIELAYQSLNQLFGFSEPVKVTGQSRSVSKDDNKLDWQKVAACIALTHNFSVISGGPGTGKTTTVIRLIALLLSQPLLTTDSIALVAPTGKAAARLSESIAAKKSELTMDVELVAQIPTQASTIHRLLGIRQDGLFHHHAGNKLNLDVLIVDEASMVDIALMVRLLEALPHHTKVILLGDKDQLSSVEAGSVLSDLCQSNSINRLSLNGQSRLSKLLYGSDQDLSWCFDTTSSEKFSDCITELKHSYRFDANSGIGQLAYGVNAGDNHRSSAVLSSVEFSDVELRPKLRDHHFELITQASEQYSEYLSYQDNPVACLRAFNRFRVLTAVKEGPFGSIALNQAIEKRLQQQGKIITADLYYPGLPIMIMQNNYQVNLFNGDIGIFIRMPSSHELRVIFDDGEGGYRDIAPALLPSWEPAFVMTVHKSQGSEFDTVAMVLPDRPSLLLTREMLYTGITRAKKTFTLYGTKEELQTCINSPTQRYSGLIANLSF